MSNLCKHWQLNPDVDFLNHGSFGAAPAVVLQAQRSLQDALERDPIEFLAPERQLESHLDTVREAVAALVGADTADIAPVRNATDGVNAVLRSFPLNRSDEIVITDHGYNACNNAARFVAERVQAAVRIAHIPFPLNDPADVVAAIEAAFTDRTRLLLVDHVTSPTALVLPIDQIIASAHAQGIRVLVDGAHAPGMLPINLRRLDPDYYTANHHKWLCGPKSSGFLYVRRELQPEVRPTVISHGANRPRPGRSRFLSEFAWTGTFDPTPLLAMPTALRFLDQLRPGGFAAHMSANNQLAQEAREVLLAKLGSDPPAPTSMLGSMATLPLPPAAEPPAGKLDPLQQRLFAHYRIEVPILRWPDPAHRWIRISAQAYNDIAQYERLAQALLAEL